VGAADSLLESHAGGIMTLAEAPTRSTARAQVTAQQPLVSVVVCAYNAGVYLRPAVQSIIDQTYLNLEILLIDDGSTDGSVDAIADLRDRRLRIIRQTNRGKPAALNRALQLMRGEFYAIQDADDQSHPRRIERQVNHLLAHPQLAAVFCGHELILEGRRIAPVFRHRGPAQCRAFIDAFRMPSHDPTAMFRLSMVGGLAYDETLRIGQGFDYILRVGERHPIEVLGECLYSYRVHDAGATRRDPSRRLEYLRELRRRAEIRRGITPAPVPELRPLRKWRNRDYDNNLAAHFMDSVVCLRRSGRWIEAVKAAMRCSRIHPLDWHYHKPAMLTVLPLGWVGRIRTK
jgi:glycosyltransferase involved in cell wall biosynthesis